MTDTRNHTNIICIDNVIDMVLRIKQLVNGNPCEGRASDEEEALVLHLLLTFGRRAEDATKLAEAIAFQRAVTRSQLS